MELQFLLVFCFCKGHCIELYEKLHPLAYFPPLASRWLRVPFCFYLSLFAGKGLSNPVLSIWTCLSTRGVVFLFQALWWLLRYYSVCALWKGAFSEMSLPIFYHVFSHVPFEWNACVLSTHRYSHERSGVTGMGVGLVNVNSKYIFFSCLLVSYIHGYSFVIPGLTLSPPSYPAQILAPGNNWFGTFFSFISSCRHSNFHLSQDLYYWSLMVRFTLANASIPIPIGLTLVCWPIWELASS